MEGCAVAFRLEGTVFRSPTRRSCSAAHMTASRRRGRGRGNIPLETCERRSPRYNPQSPHNIPFLRERPGLTLQLKRPMLVMRAAESAQLSDGGDLGSACASKNLLLVRLPVVRDSNTPTRPRLLRAWSCAMTETCPSKLGIGSHFRNCLTLMLRLLGPPRLLVDVLSPRMTVSTGPASYALLY